MKSLVVLIQLLVTTAFAGSHFEQINRYVDKDCPTWSIERFSNIQKFIYFGVQDAKKYGYTYGFPISRTGVDDVWCVLERDRGMFNKSCSKNLFQIEGRPFAHLAGKAPFESEIDVSYYDREEQMNAYLNYVRKVAQREHIKRPNVGAVLEILSRLYLQKLTNIYPAKDFAVGSGVEYADGKNRRTIGELDIIVYDRVTCKVVALGESKASSTRNQRKSLSKAKKQIQRFRNFLSRKL